MSEKVSADRKKNKRYVKRRFRELEQDIDEEEKQISRVLKRSKTGFDVLQQALSEHGDRLAPSQLEWLKKAIKRKYSKGVDLGYIKTVLFPEYFSYDIPQPLTNLAYCRFDDKQDVTINTGADGSGMVIWFPRTTQGPSLLYLPCGDFKRGSTTDKIALPYLTPIPLVNGKANTQLGVSSTSTVSNCFDNTQWRYGLWKSYQKYFTQTNLVAASISLQYIGQVEQESGIWVGGHIYGQQPNQLVVDDIENAQYVTKRRLHEGLRFVHLPMDAADYEYYQTSRKFSHNAGAQATGNETVAYIVNGDDTQAQSAMFPGDTTAMDLSGPPSVTGGSGIYINDSDYKKFDGIQMALNTNYIAIYWSGLPQNKNWIRIDTARRFNGIPKQGLRDVVNVTRCRSNYDAKKTFDVLRQLCINTPVGGHALKEVDLQMERIISNLPNVVPLSERVSEMAEIKTMEDFAGSLEVIAPAA